MKFSESERGKKLWKENWDRNDLIAGDISGFTQWFMNEAYEQGRKDERQRLKQEIEKITDNLIRREDFDTVLKFKENLTKLFGDDEK